VNRTSRCSPVAGSILTGVCLGLAFLAGCGVLTARRTEFANQTATADGRELYVEDIEEIIDNDVLSAEDQAEALRELGIEDEDLIAALVSL
jgi:hypothetical protein